MENWEILEQQHEILKQLNHLKQNGQYHLSAKEFYEKSKDTFSKYTEEDIEEWLQDLVVQDILLDSRSPNSSTQYFFKDKSERILISKQLLKLARQDKLISTMNSVSISASKATKRLVTNQIQFNNDTKDYNKEIKDATTTTKKLVLLQTFVFIVQLIIMISTNNRDIENQEKNKLELINQEEKINAYQQELSRFLNSLSEKTDTVFVKNLKP